jgi:aminoglycoside phosphotransferase (APT) family kinase protein
VRLDGTPAVLRHPPARAGLPTAHDLAREHRFLIAVAGSGVQVPKVVAFCDDATVAGLPFLVLERLSGRCLIRDPLEGLDGDRLARGAIEVLAALHAIDWRERGLEARPGSYLERQVDRWKRQLEQTPTAGRLSRLDAIHAWLADHLPADADQTIVHGDFGFHNLLVDANGIGAVLDWELATIGDPLTDLMGLMKGWGADAPAPNPAHRELTTPPAAPGRDALAAWYERATGRTFGENRIFYEVLGIWKSIGILEGIHARSEGQRFVEEVPALTKRVWSMIERQG